MNSVLLHSGVTMDPDELKVPKAPDEWVYPAPNTLKGGSTFEKVDNPGRWSSFSYRPALASESQGGQYKARCLPAGCQAVPPNEYDAAIHTHGG